MTRALLNFVVLCVGALETSAIAQTGTGSKPQLETESVFVVVVVDTSATMAKAIAAMTAAEIEQLRRTLHPGDVYARVQFDGSARTTVLQRVQAADDVELIATVLAAPEARGQKTSISAGLAAARELVGRVGVNQRVVLVLATDGENDPPHAAAVETQRLDEVSRWWRERTATDRILVGVQKKNNSALLERLALGLDAASVSVDDYREKNLIERAITEARAEELAPPAPPLAVRGQGWWPYLAGLVGAVGLGALAFRRRQRAQQLVESVHAATALPAPPIQSTTALFATTSAGGNVSQSVIPTHELDDNVVTIGTAGTLYMPGLSGTPIQVRVGPDGMTVGIDAGAPVRINGEPPSEAEVFVGRQCVLSHKGVALNLQIRSTQVRRSQAQPASGPKIRVVARRRLR